MKGHESSLNSVNSLHDGHFEGIKKRHAPTVGVPCTEVSILYRCLLRKSQLYY